MSKIILINQRTDKYGKFKEKRDNLDVRFIRLILGLGMTPMIIPNNRNFISSFLSKKIKYKGIILSPGGDPKKKDERSFVEEKLINFSKKTKTPLLGICRGAQKLNLYFGGKTIKVKNHVKKQHRIYGKIINKKKISVNSYHDYGITKRNLSKSFNVLASSRDGSIECFINKDNKMLGIMWHPERYLNIRNFDKKLIQKFFQCN